MVAASLAGPAERLVWPVMLVAVAAISSLGFACVTPFAAFAVAAAFVLPLRSALFAMAGVWIANQAIGFACLDYPLAADTLLWGTAIGAAALVATGVAAVALRRSAGGRVFVSIGSGFVAAFAAYEGILFLVSLVLGGQEGFAPDIIVKFGLLNAAWAIALVAASMAWGYARAGRTGLPGFGRVAG